MRQIKIGRNKLFLLGFLLLITLTLPLRARADNVIDGYSSKQTLEPGQVVAVDKTASRSVKPAPADDSNQIYGVVVDPSDAAITLVGDNTKTFVATTGTYQVLVSTINGSIKSGDYISMSNVDGIAAKAANTEPIILGKATSGFDGKSGAVTTSGKAAIGRVYVNIDIQKNPLANSDPTLPYFLRRVANSIANKSVPVIRVYTALLIFLISVLAAFTILWGGVRGSQISLGRNPLSKKVIFSGMYKVVFTGLGVFIIGLAGVYLLLKV